MHETTVTVRFGETDALGHVNNASYFVYLEEARIRFFETLGYSMEIKNWNFILASTKIDFIRQGYFNQCLTIKSNVKNIGNKSFELEHTIVCAENGDVIARGSAVIVFFDFTLQKSAPIPDSLKERLSSYLVHQ